MMRIKSRVIHNALILGTAAVVLTGCRGAGTSGNENGNNGKNSSMGSNEYGANIPYVDQFDAGMSQAHFISVPLENHVSNADDKSIGFESSDNTIDIYNYEVSYNLEVQNTSACVVLGSKAGEYGELILCEISDNENADFDSDGNVDGALFTVKRFNNGVLSSSFETHDVAFSSDESHRYTAQLVVSGEKLNASVNGVELGSWQIPGFSLGCVGTYKSRGTTVAYLDDLVVSESEELQNEAGKIENSGTDTVLLSDDFDGDFVNRLYNYNYYNEATSAFSPYHIRTAKRNSTNSLVVSSGLTLSETKADAAPRFMREFKCESKELQNAYLYLTALGSYEAYINGKKVSEDYFAPGKMVYDQSLEYMSYDVTDLISSDNTLDIDLFHGFFDRGSGYPEAAGRWGKGNALKGELVLVYKNGDTEVIPTDDTFKVCKESRYRFDDIYNGEMIDDRYTAFAADEAKEDADQSENSGNADGAMAEGASGENAQWIDVAVDDVDEAFLSAKIIRKKNEPITVVEERECLSVDEPVKGHFVYDFGQNFAGTISFNLSDFSVDELKEGQVITFRYGELLNTDAMVNCDGENGTVWAENLFTARATDYYVCGSEEAEEITFAHTYHGFRYLEIKGLDKKIEPQNIKALVLSSGMEETGTFECSSEIINNFYNNSRYSMRSNLMDVPTDCAQRDERLGWSGDAGENSLFAMYQFGAKKFYENYLEKLRLSQMDDGAFPDVVPFRQQFGGHNCWGDAAVLITWNHYLQYGDRAVIEENYDALCKWVDYLAATSDEFLRTSHGYGDHLAAQETDETLSDTAYCAHSARLVAKMAGILGKNEDAAKYNGYADEYTKAWQNRYIREDGAADVGILYPEYESETAYSLGIMFNLFPDRLKEEAKVRLKLLTDYSGYGFYPGYSGMANFLPALAAGGNSETAVKVLTNTAPGGIAYPISMGLTTNPEELAAIRLSDESGNPYEDGRYRVSGSLNHAAYSSVCSFLFSDILGIRPDEEKPGYEEFYVSPAYACGLGYAQGSFRTAFGTISVKWNAAEKKVEGEVPHGTACTLTLGNGEMVELGEGTFQMTW